MDTNPTALTRHGAGLSLAMGELSFLKPLCDGTRPPCCHCPRGTLWVTMHDQEGNTSVLARGSA